MLEEYAGIQRLLVKIAGNSGIFHYNNHLGMLNPKK